MDLPNDWFRGKSPAEIIAKVATITLANISLLGERELKRIGWLDNVVIDKLYTITNAGQWIARTDTSGRIATVEQNSSSINSKIYAESILAIGIPYVSSLYAGDIPTSQANSSPYQRRVARIPVTLDGAGQALNTILIPDPAGAYYPVLDGFIIKPNAGCAIAGGMTMLFEAPAGTAIETIVTAALVENTPITTFLNYPVWNTTDNEALVVDITGSGGAADAAKTFTLIVYYHYET